MPNYFKHVKQLHTVNLVVKC